MKELARGREAAAVELLPEWGNLFLREEAKERARRELLARPADRRSLLEDLFGPLDEGAYRGSALFALLERHRPEIVVDCINTATAIAYQDLCSEPRSACDGPRAAEASWERRTSSRIWPPLRFRS